MQQQHISSNNTHAATTHIQQKHAYSNKAHAAITRLQKQYPAVITDAATIKYQYELKSIAKLKMFNMQRLSEYRKLSLI